MPAEPIVVTGWGLVTPLGADVPSTWDGLFSDRAPFQRLGGPEWAGFEEPKAAQALEAWIPQGLARRDRSIQLGLVAAEEAWKVSGLQGVLPERIGTTFSSSKGGIRSLLGAGGDPTVSWDFLGDFFPHACGQALARRFGFSGPALSVASACSTGIGSMALGIRLIEDGECDVVVAGSTESSIHPLLYAGFRNMGLFSEREGGPAPFDRYRDGFLMGEGAGVLVLEGEGRALKRKAKPLVRVASAVLGGDAWSPMEMDPSGRTIAALVQRALDRAGLCPSDIGYVNAHGTGTRSNDLVESRALERIFGAEGVPVSSTKGATGHLLGAAGSVEAILSGLALLKGELPGTRNLEDPDPECKVRHVGKGGLKRKVDHVLSLSYGFGGQLGAVILSKA